MLFMTCRDASALEPALIRPGRIDTRLAFEAPDKAQAKALFRHFYGLDDEKRHATEEAKERMKKTRLMKRRANVTGVTKNARGRRRLRRRRPTRGSRLGTTPRFRRWRRCRAY